MIRHAAIRDVPEMGKIINDCAEYGLMLHRSQSYLYEHVREFHVAQDHQNRVVGVCGLSVVWANLAEVYALAVQQADRGRGLGQQLVAACVEEAIHLGIPKLMTLTYEVRFFESCGFEKADRANLPLKIWGDCIRCSKNQACDEVAMTRVLEIADPIDPCDPPAIEKVEIPVEVTVEAGRVGRRSKMDEAH